MTVYSPVIWQQSLLLANSIYSIDPIIQPIPEMQHKQIKKTNGQCYFPPVRLMAVRVCRHELNCIYPTCPCSRPVHRSLLPFPGGELVILAGVGMEMGVVRQQTARERGITYLPVRSSVAIHLCAASLGLSCVGHNPHPSYSAMERGREGGVEGQREKLREGEEGGGIEGEWGWER